MPQQGTLAILLYSSHVVCPLEEPFLLYLLSFFCWTCFFGHLISLSLLNSTQLNSHWRRSTCNPQPVTWKPTSTQEDIETPLSPSELTNTLGCKHTHRHTDTHLYTTNKNWIELVHMSMACCYWKRNKCVIDRGEVFHHFAYISRVFFLVLLVFPVYWAEQHRSSIIWVLFGQLMMLCRRKGPGSPPSLPPPLSFECLFGQMMMDLINVCMFVKSKWHLKTMSVTTKRKWKYLTFEISKKKYTQKQMKSFFLRTI